MDVLETFNGVNHAVDEQSAALYCAFGRPIFGYLSRREAIPANH